MRYINYLKVVLILFSIVFISTTNVSFANNDKLTPNGEVVLVKQKCDAMLVVKKIDKSYFRKNDVIFSIRDYDNPNILYTDDNLIDLYKEKNKKVKVRFNRDRSVREKVLTSDDVRNVSLSNTMTFLATITATREDGTFIGMGHNCKFGSIYLNSDILVDSEIYNIEYIKEGKVKPIIGGYMDVVVGNTNIGEVDSYKEYGMSGHMSCKNDTMQPMELDKPQVGEAYIYCKTPIQNEFKMHKIDILKVHEEISEIKVLDKDLLKYRGGLIGGMSGSPVIQDGKLVGAVRSKSVLDSSGGYITNIQFVNKGGN